MDEVLGFAYAVLGDRHHYARTYPSTSSASTTGALLESTGEHEAFCCRLPSPPPRRSVGGTSGSGIVVTRHRLLWGTTTLLIPRRSLGARFSGATSCAPASPGGDPRWNHQLRWGVQYFYSFAELRRAVWGQYQRRHRAALLLDVAVSGAHNIRRPRHYRLATPPIALQGEVVGSSDPTARETTLSCCNGVVRQLRKRHHPGRDAERMRQANCAPNRVVRGTVLPPASPHSIVLRAYATCVFCRTKAKRSQTAGGNARADTWSLATLSASSPAARVEGRRGRALRRRRDFLLANQPHS